jgi:HK97 gp10 family phage protein
MALQVEGKVVIYPDAADKVTNTPEARTFLEQVAASGAEHARENAPVRTGAYQDSITSEIQPGERPAAMIEAGTDYWQWLEFGTIHNRPYRVLTNALAYATDKVEMT